MQPAVSLCPLSGCQRTRRGDREGRKADVRANSRLRLASAIGPNSKPTHNPLAQPPARRVSVTVVTHATPPTPTNRLAGLIDALCQAVARRGGGRDRLAGPLVILIWSRLRRLAAQVAALAARIEAGRHRRYPARRPPRAAPRRHTPPSLPHGPAWLLPLVPEAASSGSQLQYLLARAGDGGAARRGTADAPPAPPALPDARGAPAAGLAPRRTGPAGSRRSPGTGADSPSAAAPRPASPVPAATAARAPTRPRRAGRGLSGDAGARRYCSGYSPKLPATRRSGLSRTGALR